jgi:hypothetical protein
MRNEGEGEGKKKKTYKNQKQERTSTSPTSSQIEDHTFVLKFCDAQQVKKSKKKKKNDIGRIASSRVYFSSVSVDFCQSGL